MKRLLIFLFLPVVSFFLISCNSLNDSDTATVTIDTGIMQTKAEAPSDVTSISLTVTGSGMSDINASIPTSTGVLTLGVPVGTARLFSVTAVAGNFTYLGSTTQDIAAGATVVVSISMVKQAATANLNISDFHNNTPASPYIDNYMVTITDTSTSNSFDTTASPDSGIITVEVPAGSLDISVSANINASTNQSAVTAASGSTSATFAVGETRDLIVDIKVTETKILIPDYQNNRIVQIDDDFTNPNWIEINGTEIAALGTTDPFTVLAQFRPYDIDFDSNGRIFIANNYGGSGMGTNCVIRIDNISGSNYITFSEPEYDYGIIAISVDRNNNYVYYAVSNTLGTIILYRSDLDGNNETPLSTTAGVENIYSISGMAVDENEVLFITGTTGSALASFPRVFIYDPVTQVITTTYGTGTAPYDITSPWDVIVKSPYVYVANLENLGSENKVLQFTQDLQLTSAPPLYIASDESDSFHGPHRFVAILNNRFYLIDEDENVIYLSETERIVAFDNISGDNWEAFDPSMVGQSRFEFYSTS